MASNWGSFTPDAFEAFMSGRANPINTMTVAPALASRANHDSYSFDGYEDEDDYEDEEWEDEEWEDEEEGEETETNAPMAMSQLRSMADDIMNILSEMSPYDELEPWIAAKITISKQNISAVADHLRFSGEY